MLLLFCHGISFRLVIRFSLSLSLYLRYCHSIVVASCGSSSRSNVQVCVCVCVSVLCTRSSQGLSYVSNILFGKLTAVYGWFYTRTPYTWTNSLCSGAVALSECITNIQRNYNRIVSNALILPRLNGRRSIFRPSPLFLSHSLVPRCLLHSMPNWPLVLFQP